MISRQEAFIAAGHLARYVGSGVVARAVTAPDNVRVALSHDVPDEHLAQYRAIVRYLAGKRRVVTPAEFFSYYAGGDERTPIQGRSVLFTFDDGLLSSYRAAREVLDPLGIKAAFFVPTIILELEGEEEMRRFVWERVKHARHPIESLRPAQYLTMTRRELLELHRAGHAVFPHTHSHMNISQIRSADEVETELRRPRLVLEDLLQTECNAFAFPVGNDRVVNAFSFGYVGELYDYCFWALAGANTATTNPLLLHRDSIHPWHSLGHVRSLVGGSYDAYHGLRQTRISRQLDVGRRPVCMRSETNGAAPAGASSPRSRFVERVGGAFAAAGVDYVILHGSEPDHPDDSDLDVAVDRKGAGVVDAILRTGALGRLVQCFHYAPRSRYYVLQSTEPGRRYRELDVVCDQAGIGRDGTAVRVALAHAVDHEGLRVPAPGATTLYLAAKKARKGASGPEAAAALLRAYERDPAGSDDLLGRHLGAAGRELALALARGERNLDRELAAVRATLRRCRRTPQRLARRAALEGLRGFRRVVRPAGLVVAVAGPDGTGKSTLADGLERSELTPFRSVRRHHLRPELLPSPACILRRAPADGTQPHGRPPSGIGGSVLRLAYLWLDTIVGWLPKMVVPEIRGALVVVERGWLDLLVDPRRYRLSSPPSLTRLLGKLLPEPSAIVRLDAPAPVLAARTAELEPAELDRQLGAWRQLADAAPERFDAVDATLPQAGVLARTLDAIDDRLAARQRDLGACELGLAALGGLRVDGAPYSVVFAPRGPLGHGPRWLLPRRVRARGPLGMQLFRPARRLHRAPALGLELAQRTGIGRIGTPVTVAPERGVGPAIADALGLPGVELGVAITGDAGRGSRVLLAVSSRGRVVAFAKVAREERQKLERERRVLELLAAAELETLVVPEVLGSFGWRDCSVLLLEPLDVRRLADRRLGGAEVAGIGELMRLSTALAPVLGTEPGLVPVHGDFAPWNCSPGPGRLVLWDWEEARLGLPFEDLFYWRLQRLLRFGRGGVEALVDAALRPADDVAALCDRLSIPPSVAPRALEACLVHTLEQRRSVASAGPAFACAIPVVEDALAALAADAPIEARAEAG